MEAVRTETRIGGKLYILTAECSPAATETVEKKLERLICRHASDTKSYQPGHDISLAIPEEVRKHGTNTI